MSLRTIANSQQRQNLLDLQQTKERMALNQMRITSGKRLTRPGDDPTAAALILDFGTSIKANNQFVKQADSALSFLTTTENVVTSAIDANMRLLELATQGTGAATAGARSAIISELDGIRANLLSMANTKSEGKFIFGGTQTQPTAANPLPFNDAAPPAAPTYVGNSGTISLDVTDTTSVVTNIPGDQVFLGTGGPAGSNIFQAVSDLRAALVANNVAGVQTAAGNLRTSLDFLTKVQTDLGGRQSSLFNLQDMLSSFNVSLQDLQNHQQDTDYPTAMTELATDQTIQSATLSAMARTAKTNLFDYLA